MRKGKQLMEHSMSDAILNQIKADAFERGIKTALNELRDVYGEGLEETDIWAEYMEASK
jgi:proline racemase